LTKALANEWADKGINVNAIAPGYMATDNTTALRADPRAPAILEQDSRDAGACLRIWPARRFFLPRRQAIM
jgi:NAD(P)-dependent dehydrogenase (short-subunit alcohol dehydrogenase family)